MTTNQPAPITQEQIAIAVQGFAQGDKISAIAEQTGLSPYRVRGLLKKKEVADAIDRMRLTDTIPTQLCPAWTGVSGCCEWAVARVRPMLPRLTAICWSASACRLALPPSCWRSRKP